MIKRENENVNFNVTPPKENTVLFFPPILESQAPTSSIEAQLLNRLKKLNKSKNNSVMKNFFFLIILFNILLLIKRLIRSSNLNSEYKNLNNFGEFLENLVRKKSSSTELIGLENRKADSMTFSKNKAYIEELSEDECSAINISEDEVSVFYSSESEGSVSAPVLKPLSTPVLKVSGIQTSGI